ncbi:MAG: hypothetical protein ABI954_12620 [Pyrinomonadaceae bacterium]
MKKFLTKIWCFSCLLLALTATTEAQQITVDKMMATVSDGVGTKLITYSDLLWQLALEPDASLETPSKDDLNQVLERLTQQRLIALEAERLPAAAPTDDAVSQEIRRLVAAFPSAANFEARLRRVGFESTDDPNFRQIIEQRLAINNYLDFRFRSFVVVTPQDEEQFYNDTFVTEFRRANPGVVVPSLDQTRERVNKELTERRIESDIEKFLEEAKVRAIITVLNPI